MLGINPAFDRVAVEGHRLPDFFRQTVPAATRILALHQIDAGDRFGDRMFP